MDPFVAHLLISLPALAVYFIYVALLAACNIAGGVFKQTVHLPRIGEVVVAVTAHLRAWIAGPIETRSELCAQKLGVRTFAAVASFVSEFALALWPTGRNFGGFLYRYQAELSRNLGNCQAIVPDAPKLLPDDVSMAADFWTLIENEAYLVALSKHPRSPIVMHARDPSIAPHIVVTLPSAQDDLWEPWVLMENALPFLATDSTSGFLQAPLPVIEWVTRRPPFKVEAEGGAPVEATTSSNTVNGPNVSKDNDFRYLPLCGITQREVPEDYWEDPAMNILAFYRQCRAVILESENPQEAPHIVISRPYEPPPMTAHALYQNCTPYPMQGMLRVDVERPLPVKTNPDCSFDDSSSASSTCTSLDTFWEDDLEEDEPQYKTLPDQYRIDEDDEDLGPLPSW